MGLVTPVAPVPLGDLGRVHFAAIGGADGGGQAFVAEADESDGSFLMLSPAAAVVTSIEADHLDNYGSLAEIEDAFAAFTAKITAGGLLVTCADDAGARRLAQRSAG